MEAGNKDSSKTSQNPCASKEGSQCFYTCYCSYPIWAKKVCVFSTQSLAPSLKPCLKQDLQREQEDYYLWRIIILINKKHIFINFILCCDHWEHKEPRPKHVILYVLRHFSHEDVQSKSTKNPQRKQPTLHGMRCLGDPVVEVHG